MKKLNLILVLVLGLFISVGARAQSTANYFPGKWAVTVMGTPNGDSKMIFVFERKDGKLTGAVRDTTGKELAKITQIDENAKSITAAFNIQSYDVTLTLDPIDDDHVKGSLIGAYEAKGVRIKETK
ncbi:hypothetical protein [Mucilaginibacter sp.]|uniref:hypothetical protein n=1 Tax=Mucilaginibacter sp. TaxID=1882438 RepID=UPI003D0F6E16